MDGASWKRILLHWANQTCLLERVYYNIEQTDVDVFFEKFRSQMKTVAIPQTDLLLFLKEKYPDFEVHLDDGNNLCSPDYMYVYSLLLHYSCVKCPEPFFHEACQSLPEQFQQAIASFFKILMESDSLNRETIRFAIHTSSPKSPIRFMPLDSPIRTPRGKISPPTPKTSMLEDRTRELNLLKAQLDSERYEKGFVELQLKQNEEKIQKLTQEQKANQAEIYNLKNELLAKNTENLSPSRNFEEEQIKKRLRKNIAEKEEAILNLRENLESLGEEKTLLLDKLAYAESQVTVCLDKIKEMDYIINELKSEIEKRDLTIQTLTETKNELELFISESRSSSQGGRNDFNMSVECLDVSLSRTTNSSGSILSSPENLGVSVIDIKLREKEQENIILTERIEQMQADCEKLSRHVYDLIVRYADTFDICSENLVVTDDADLTHTIMVFENYIQKMVESYTKANKNMKLVKEENADLKSQNAIITNKISELEEQLEMHRKQIESLRSEKVELEDKNTFLSVQSTEHQEKIKGLSEQYADVQSRLDALHEKYEQHKLTTAEKGLQIEARLNEALNNLLRLSSEKSKLEGDKRNLEEKTCQLTETLQKYSEKLKSLEDSNGNLLISIATHIEQARENENVNSELKCQMEKLERAIEMLNEEKNTLLEDKMTMQTKLSSTECELGDLRAENAQQIEHNQKLKDEIEKFAKSLVEAQNELQVKSSHILELEDELAKSNKKINELNATISELIQRRDQLENACCNLDERVSALNEKINEHSDVIRSIQEDYDNDYRKMELEIQSIQSKSSMKLQNYKKTVENLKNEVKRLNDENHKIEQQNLEIINEVDRYRVELVKLEEGKALGEKQLVDEKKVLEGKCNLISSKNLEIERELTSLLTYLGSQDSSGGDSAISMANNVENPIMILKERMSSMLTTNVHLSKSEVELRSIVADLKNQMLELKRSSDDLSTNSENLAAEAVEFQYRINCLEEEKMSLNVEVDRLKNKLEELESSKLELEEKSRQHETTVKKLLEKVNSLTSEKNCFSEEVSSLQTEETALKEMVEKLEALVASHVQNEGKLNVKVIETEKYLEEATEKRLLMDEQLEKQKAIIENLQTERDNLDEDLKTHMKRASDDQAKLQHLQNEHICLSDQINQLNNELADAKVMEVKLKVSLDENESTKKEFEEKKNSLQNALQEIQKLTESLEVLKSAQKNLEEAAVDREVQIKALEETILAREVKIKELNDIITESNINIVGLQRTIENLQLIIEDKESARDEWRQLLQTADAESKNLSEKYKETVENLENRINDLEKERTILLSDNNSMKENSIDTESSLKHAQTVNVELLSKIDELKSSLSEITERETEYINMQLRYVALNAEKEQLISSKQKLEENCTKLTKRVEKLSIKVGDLQANAAKLDKMNSESRLELETLQKTFQHKNKQIDELRSKVDASQQDLRLANEEVSKLRKALAEKTNENVALTRELEETCKRFETGKQAMQRELNVATERASSLQTLYNEEVAKTVATSLDLQQVRNQFGKKLSEIEDQKSFLCEIQTDLNSKKQTVERLNQDLEEIKKKNEQLCADNNSLADKVKLMISTEAELKRAETTIKELESRNKTLQAQLDELSATKENLKEATSHIDNIKHELELKVEQLSTTLEKMSAALQSAQKENVGLRDKIECLCELTNHTIVKTENESNSITEDNIESRYQILLQNIKQQNTSKGQVEERNMKLASDLETSREENSQLSDKLSKLSLRLQILEKENIELGNDVKDLQTAYDAVRSERDVLHLENQNTLASLQELQAQQQEILHEHVVAQDILKERIERYENQLSERAHAIEKLEDQLLVVGSKDNVQAKEFQVQQEEFQQLKEKFQTLEKQLIVEREHNEKLKKDIAIFQAKLFKNRQTTEEKEQQWQEERDKLHEEIRMSESRIKDNRLELEGKLEKMKNKMKTLYNDEVTKIKSKQEREIAEYRAKLESLMTKNEKYEAHVQKLAKHVFNLNETILELQKQNKFMETKLKDQESIPSSSLRRQSQFASQMIGSNLRMEDEEGELFNNTYLADLKNGRMSPFGRDSVSVNELHYRNSLAPPHLRSTYMAQYPDHHLREEDIKDVPISLDDSLSSLLNAGQRKKMSGTTSYKKPGPPTPSKNGGRLSFGGGEREILKECNDISVSSSRRVTPSKFRTLFSSSRMKDENTPPKRRLSNLFQRKK